MHTHMNVAAITAILVALASPTVASAKRLNHSKAELPANSYASTVVPTRQPPATSGQPACSSIVRPYAADSYVPSCGERGLQPDFQLTRSGT